MGNSNIENQEEHFRKVMQQHTDEELIKVLRQRKHYQHEAARQAVVEAIRRGLINTEADLQDSRFLETSDKFSIFPKIESQIVRNKVWRSITRSMIIVGLLPLIWAAVNRYNISDTGLVSMVIYGLVWIFIAFRLMQTQNLKMAYGLLILLIPAVVYYVRLMWFKSSFELIQIVIPLVLIGFIFYGVGFLRKLKM
jgi:hypothetical protein